MADRLGRGVGVSLVIFASVSAFVMAMRADQTTIALIGGMFVGGLILLPAFLVALFVTLRVLLARQNRDDAPSAPEPPLIEAPPSWSVVPRRINVPIIMQRGAPVILTTVAEVDGERVELGADIDTLRKLAPLVGVRSPTRAAAREVGIVSNAELAEALDWLTAHGWCTPGAQGVARQWTGRATPTAFAAWLDSLQPAAQGRQGRQAGMTELDRTW